MDSLTKDMGITHADFWRIIPAVMEGYHWTSQGNQVLAEQGGSRIVIRIAPEGVRTIAMFNIPTTLVTLEFSGVTPEQRSAFLALFDRRFQRGGG